MNPLHDDDEFVPEIGFDPEAVLERNSRVLLDPSFLAPLHEELASELSAEEATITLLQMGFLHGLQDATRVLASPFGPGQPVFTPPLRMPCRSCGSHGAGIRVEGAWPEHREAEARLVALGPAKAAACDLSAGYASGWLSGAFDADLLAVETDCSAAGAAGCTFVAREAAAWRAAGEAGVLRRLTALPFDAFRALVRERVARRARASSTAASNAPGRVDRRATAVHVWGPVMVIPWTGPDEALQTLEMLARDASAAEVSVIIVDLHGAEIDHGYGASALERLVQTSDAWGTEVLLVDPSPLSQALLADLDPAPLLTLKDLEPAVTLAFQIARSQRRVV